MLTYCHVDRSKILDAVRKVMPSALDLIQRRLSAVQDVIYFGNELGPDTIKQVFTYLFRGVAPEFGQTV